MAGPHRLPALKARELMQVEDAATPAGAATMKTVIATKTHPRRPERLRSDPDRYNF